MLGVALNEVFVPLLQKQFPEITDFYLPPEGCSYRVITSYSIHYTKLYELKLEPDEKTVEALIRHTVRLFAAGIAVEANS